MKRRIALLTVLIVLCLLAGCSSKSVVFDFSETADFTQFRTFQYAPTNTTFESTNPLAHGRIVAAINREMRAAGLTEVDNDPDVFVSYYGGISEETHLTTTHMGYSTWSSHHWHSRGGMVTSTTTATTLTTGTLIIDIWDARQDVLVWRGEVSDSLTSDPGRNADIINRAIASVLANFPPR